MSITTIFLLFGGLGLFLFGMKMMSDGLEQVAGARMRSILEFFTRNRFKGLLVGLVFTAIIQSSSATTVMVVSFVNSGLMDLYQAAGVILGANIGTTMTGQLIAFNLSDVAPLFVICGAVMYLFAKKVNVRWIGSVILGFGILFMGLGTMSDAMSALRESTYVVDVLKSLTSPFAAILAGLIITAILQSSSATVGIVILLAQQGLLDLHICFFLILGCNIGTCVSALLASIGAKKEAKRAAWIHFLFNIFASTVSFTILWFINAPFADALMEFSGNNIGRAVANAHTLIKLFEVCLMFPFTPWIVNLTYKIVPGKDLSPEDSFSLQYINIGRINSTTAVVDAISELRHMGQVAVENLKLSMQALCEGNLDKTKVVYKREAYIDYMDREITNYLVKVSSMDIPLADSKMIGGLFHVVNDLERIGDHAENFADATQERAEKHIDLSEKAITQMQEMTEMVVQVTEYALEMFSQQSPEHMKEVVELERAVDERERKLQKRHVKRLAKGECTAQAGMMFSDVISGLERVADHATNIAFAIMEPDDLSEADEES